MSNDKCFSLKLPRRESAVYGLACVAKSSLSIALVNFAVSTVVNTFLNDTVISALTLAPCAVFFCIGCYCVLR